MIKKISTLGFLLFIYLGSYSQIKILRGKVVDDSGRPITYASITFKGFSYGTKTDRDGNYIATISKEYDSIVCTHTSYMRRVEKIEGNTTINLVMEKMKLPATTLSIDTILNSKVSSLVEGKENEKD